MKTSTKSLELNHKVLASSGCKILDEEKGIVEAFVAGIGNKDSVGDIIQPGAFDDSIDAIMPKGVWSHDWNRPVSKTLEIYEVSAGDSRLPQKMKAAGIGGLYVKTQFNLDTQDGRDAFSWVKFFGDQSEWSIGYQTLEEEWDKKVKANLLHKVKLFEYSPVLFGANPLTSTVGVKVTVVSNGEENDVQIKIEGIDDDAKKDAITAALEAAVKAQLQEEAGDDGDDSGEVVVDGAKADEANAPVETETLSEEEADPDTVVKADGQEEGSEGSDSDATKVDDEEEKVVVAVAVAVESEGEDEDEMEDETGEGEKSLSQVVESFMAFAEKAEFTRSEAKAIEKFVGSRVSEKAIAGSVEQTLRTLDQELREEYESATTYVYLYATFDSTLVFYMSDYKAGEQGFYEVSYSMGDDGVTFGEAKEVDVVEVVVAKTAVMEAAFKGHTDAVKSILSPMVSFSENAPEDPDVKSAIAEGIEAKAGRKLSTKTRGLIEEAASALEKVLASDKPDDADEKDDEAAEAEKTAEGDELSAKTAEDDSTDTEAGDASEEAEEKTLVVPADELEELKALAAQYLGTEEDD